MAFILLAVLVIFSFNVLHGQYIPPQATVLPLRPIGIKISIPDEEGISLVAYHVKFNKEFNGLEAGTIARDIPKARNGKWTYEDRSTKLKEGDVIYYWVHVVFEGLGYNLLEQQHTVTEFYDYNGALIDGNAFCPKSSTKIFTITGESKSICRGNLIFEETFDNQNNINESKWNTIEQFSSSPDFEFVVYRNNMENVKVENGKLKITPTLLENTYNAKCVENGNLTLNKCTGKFGTRDCERKAQGFNILPPIFSGRINTKNMFSFQFGRIAIRAKIPQGDWIYPLMSLEPLEIQELNTEKDAIFYSHLRVAYALGNPELRSANGEDLGGHILRGGFISHTEINESGVTTLTTNDSTKKKTSSKLWSDDFHLFEMEWKPEIISLKVDGESYGEIKFDTPSQTSFYITLGVAVGGYTEFPDESISQGYIKPWNNYKSKALLNFYRTKATWFNTWKSGTSLEIDDIKIWAL